MPIRIVENTWIYYKRFDFKYIKIESNIFEVPIHFYGTKYMYRHSEELYCYLVFDLIEKPFDLTI